MNNVQLRYLLRTKFKYSWPDHHGEVEQSCYTVRVLQYRDNILDKWKDVPEEREEDELPTLPDDQHS